MSDPDINRLEALSAMLASDGWAVFTEAADAMHGDAACVQQIDAELKTVDRGDLDAARDTVVQIRARARAVQAMLRWPEEQVKALKAKKDKPGMFQHLRRA